MKRYKITDIKTYHHQESGFLLEIQKPFREERSMSEPIFLKDKTGTLTPLNEKPYELEKDLQILLAQHPELIYSVNSQISRLLLIKQEAGIPTEEGSSDDFSLDHIFVDPEGWPTFVEVKRSSDTRIRREVIGQMFDYTAHARANWSNDKIQEMFKETCLELGKDPETEIQKFIGETQDSDQFWNLVMTNLKAGNIRIIFVADTIPNRLKLIIEFLNDFMTPCEVLALEVRQFLGANNTQMIAPRYVGRSEQTIVRKGNSIRGEKWTEPQFMEALSSNSSQDDAKIAKRIVNWAASQDIRIDFGNGIEEGSLSILATKNHKGLVSFTLVSSGMVRVDFRWLKNYPPFTNIDKRIALVRKLNEIPGVSISEDLINGYPKFSIRILQDEKNFQNFVNIVKGVITELQMA